MKIKMMIAGLGLLASFNVQALDVGVGVKGNLPLGPGVDISVALTQTINARLSLTSAAYDFDETLTLDEPGVDEAEIDATLDLDFGSTAILFDWYVFDGTFHVTAGMIKNDSKIGLSGQLQGTDVIFDGTTYQITDFVDPSISGSISTGEDFEPYFGIGWGRKADDDPGLALSVEIGVMVMDPSVDLVAPQAVNPADQAQLDADVNEAESTANSELSDLEMFPVISIGLNYAF